VLSVRRRYNWPLIFRVWIWFTWVFRVLGVAWLCWGIGLLVWATATLGFRPLPMLVWSVVTLVPFGALYFGAGWSRLLLTRHERWFSEN
jgi:hypothetical protein